MGKYLELTEEVLGHFWPNTTPSFRQKTISEWPKVATYYAMDSKAVTAHFLGHITWEGDGGKELRENLSYSAGRLLEVFGEPPHSHHSAKVTAAEAKLLAHNPPATGERVYGLGNPHMARELGNVKPGDGYARRGGGWLNTTGLEAWLRVYNALRNAPISVPFDFITNPDLCEDPIVALWMAAEEYHQLGAAKFALAGDIHGETVRINGGTEGLAERGALIEHISAALADARFLTFDPARQESKPLAPVVNPVAPVIKPVVTAAQAVTRVPPETHSALVVSFGGLAMYLFENPEYIVLAGCVIIGCVMVYLAAKPRRSS